MQVSIDASPRAELPRIELIYARLRRQTSAQSLPSLLAQAHRAVRESAAARTLQRTTRPLRDAARRMTDVDLDAAWRAALRGDDATLTARVVPHVDTRPRKRTSTVSPWRMSGWLRKSPRA